MGGDVAATALRHITPTLPVNCESWNTNMDVRGGDYIYSEEKTNSKLVSLDLLLALT
jgi:hypothetical protein